MRTSLRAALFVLALVASLTSCASFRFDGQDVGFRHDAKADTLDLGIVYRGIRHEDDKSREAVERIAAGHRTFILYDWPLEVDIEAILADQPALEPAESESLEDALTRRSLAYIETITVESSGFFRDENGVPGAYQRVRFPNVQTGLDLLNEYLHMQASELEGASADPNASIEDQFAYAFAKAAHEKRSMFHLVDGVIEVHVPATPALAADLLHLLMMNPLQEADESGEALSLFGGLAAALGEMRVTEDSVVLRFLPDEMGVVNVHVDRPEWIADPDKWGYSGEAWDLSVPTLTPAELREALRSQRKGD